jgi:predicted ArsR family transcriptional regulator
MFELLVKYRDISASEAASRLGVHIRTAQDFLEGMAELGILGREEVYEKKRPYFRYRLLTDTIAVNIDLRALGAGNDSLDLSHAIRERRHSGARFTTARNGQAIGTVTVWSGKGRDRREHRVKLTAAQGRFLFHLPFPDACARSIESIMRQAGVDPEQAPEILDLVAILTEHGVLAGSSPEA